MKINIIILISPIQTKFNSHNTKMNIEEINNYISEDIIIDPNSANIDKFALKKYKPNPSLPMIILSVSANLNSFHYIFHHIFHHIFHYIFHYILDNDSISNFSLLFSSFNLLYSSFILFNDSISFFVEIFNESSSEPIILIL